MGQRIQMSPPKTRQINRFHTPPERPEGSRRMSGDAHPYLRAVSKPGRMVPNEPPPFVISLPFVVIIPLPQASVFSVISVAKTLPNIARIARYKPFGPHTFCSRKTTDSHLPICCRSEAEAYVPGATGEGRKPDRAMLRNSFVSSVTFVVNPSSLPLHPS